MYFHHSIVNQFIASGAFSGIRSVPFEDVCHGKVQACISWVHAERLLKCFAWCSCSNRKALCMSGVHPVQELLWKFPNLNQSLPLYWVVLSFLRLEIVNCFCDLSVAEDVSSALFANEIRNPTEIFIFAEIIFSQFAFAYLSAATFMVNCHSCGSFL